RRPALGDEPLRAGEEIVEDVLLVVHHAGLVPLFTVLTAAAQIGHRQQSAALQEDEATGAERGRQADVEAAVAVQHRWIVAVARQSLAMGEKHADRRAIL